MTKPAVAPTVTQRRWEPRALPLSAPAPRTPEQLAAVIDSADVERHPRYQPGHGATWCNVALWDWTRALGCEIPHWVGEPPHRRELSANGVCLWLRTIGQHQGWTRATADEAREHAALGGVSVVVWENPDGHGHVAIVRPCEKEVRIAQAGAKCLSDAPLARGFGSRPVVFYVHA